MIHTYIIFVLVISTITAKPQFVTFKDGKIGVNFGGYTAEAGLGGFLTGNSAHGGLSASAGTPFGQRAAAGIGGQVNGDAAGRAYAGAQATDSIGASAIIGGSTGPQQRGLIGAEAHSNGNTVTKTITTDTKIDVDIPHDSPELVVPTDLPKVRSVQRIKPPKKFTALTGVESRFNGEEGHIKTVRTTYNGIEKVTGPTLIKETETNPGNKEVQQVVEKDVQLNPGALNQFFNIPIGILQSIRDNLQPIGVRKQVYYTNAA